MTAAPSTTPNAPDRVEVTQGDRISAATVAHAVYGKRIADMIENGQADEHHFVQAFARHRLAALSGAAGEGVWSPKEAAAEIAFSAYHQGYRDACEDSNETADMEAARDGWHDWLHDCEALKDGAYTQTPTSAPAGDGARADALEILDQACREKIGLGRGGIEVDAAIYAVELALARGSAGREADHGA